MESIKMTHPPIILSSSAEQYFDDNFQPIKDQTFRMAMVKEKGQGIQMFLTLEQYYSHCENLTSNLFAYMDKNNIKEIIINGSDAINFDLRRGIYILTTPLLIPFEHTHLAEVYSLVEQVWPSLKNNIYESRNVGTQPIDISGKAFQRKNLEWLLY